MAGAALSQSEARVLGMARAALSQGTEGQRDLLIERCEREREREM